MYYSKNITIVLIIFFLSLWLADYFTLPKWCSLFGLLLLLIIFTVSWKIMFTLLAVILIIFGNRWYHYQFYRYDNQILQHFNRQKITGIVVGLVEAKNIGMQVEVRVDQLGGDILLQTESDFNLKYGNQITFTCQAVPAVSAAGYDLTKYWVLKKVFGLCRTSNVHLLASNQGNFFIARIYNLRERLTKKISQALPEPTASFLVGLLLGGTQSLPAEVVEYFRRTGTTHIVAVSGFNVSLIVNAVMGIFAAYYLPRRRSFWFLTIGLVIFTIMVGASASVLRAVIMAWIVILAKTIERYINIRNLIFYAAFILIVANPLVLHYDIGFQLSFCATIALVYISPWLSDILKIEKINSKFLAAAIAEYLLPTLAVSLLSAPIIAYYFEVFSTISPISNLAIAPFIPLAMSGGFALLAVSFALPFLARLFSVLAWLPLKIILLLVQFFSSWPLAMLTLGKVSVWLIVFYYLTVAVLWHRWQKRRVYA